VPEAQAVLRRRRHQLSEAIAIATSETSEPKPSETLGIFDAYVRAD
jgi:hypothetical protein